MFRHKRKNRARSTCLPGIEQYRSALLERIAMAEQGEITSTKELGSRKYHDFDVLSQEEGERFELIWKKIWRSETAREHAAEMRWIVERLSECEEATDRIDLLVKLLKMVPQLKSVPEIMAETEMLLEVSFTDYAAELQALVQRHYEQLAAKRRTKEGYLELHKFIQRSYPDRRTYFETEGDLQQAGISRLAYPDDWNDLTARLFETPALERFVGRPDRGYGDVRLLAAEAIRTNDFTQAQMALAYCNNDPKCRAAVGDVLTAELAKLVVRHRAKTRREASSSPTSSE